MTRPLIGVTTSRRGGWRSYLMHRLALYRAGARSIRIYGQDVPVGAEVVQLAAASAHADADELIAWLRSAAKPPRGVFVTHGELDASDALRKRIERELGWPACIPEYGDTVELANQPEE